LITKTPGETPYLENVTFRFRYNDFLTGESISIQKQHISLAFGPTLIEIASVNFSFTYQDPYYEISFSSAVLSETSLGSYTLELTIDRSGSIPYYAIRSKTTSATVIERPTQIFFPLVQDTPFGDTIIIDLDYVDYLTGGGIDDADIQVTSLNLTTPSFTLVRLTEGSYKLQIPSNQFGRSGIVYFDFTISISGAPFYASRSATDVIATIRLIQVSLTADTPAPGSIPVGAPMVINLTLIDYDHDTTIDNATIFTDWDILQNRNYVVDVLGNGKYRVTLNMTGLLAQEYTLHAWVVKTNYELEIITFSVQPGVATIEILLDRTTYYVDWGQDIFIEVQILDPFYGSPVPGMNVTLTWGAIEYIFADIGEGIYQLFVSSRNQDAGFYTPTISASYEFYQTRQKTFSLVVTRATGQIIPELSTVYVVVGTQTEFTVYLNDTISNLPIDGATVEMEWKEHIISMTYNGTPGFYNTTLDVGGLAIGIYDLSFTGIATNHDFLKVTVDVSVTPVPTSISLLSGVTSPRPIFGDSFDVTIGYNDTYYLGSISGATVSYLLGPIGGTFTENPDGSYSASIDTSQIGARVLRLQIRATKTNYSTGSLTLFVNIRPIPTEVTVDDSLKDGYFGDNVTFTFHLRDTHNDEDIINASLFVEWDGGTYAFREIGGGFYEVEINLNQTIPRLYELSVIFTRLNYASTSNRPGVVLRATPGEIVGPSSVSIPFNDSITISFMVNNTLRNSLILDVSGAAYWQTGTVSLLEPQEDGTFTLNIPDDVPMGTYSMDIVFESVLYTISPLTIEVVVRPIETALYTDEQQILTQRGAAIILTVSFIDLDHDIGISGILPNVTYDDTLVIYYPGYTSEPFDNGTYQLYFTVIGSNQFTIKIGFEKEDYFTPEPLIFTINSDITEEQRLQQVIGYLGGFSFFVIALALALYVRIWSIPWIIRALNRLISMLSKGRVPKPVDVRTRTELVSEFVNDELKPVGIQKEIEDITGYSIRIDVPEVDALLERLADITNLGPDELAAFRADLSRMKASERPGFLREVIEQEEARRADALAERDGVRKTDRDAELLGAQPEELESIRKKLRQKGMADSEIEIIIQQAENLSKADLEALLDSLGIRLD